MTINETKFQIASIGDEIVKWHGCEPKHGRIVSISPRRKSITVRWDSGTTTTINHRRNTAISLADRREKRQKEP